MKRSDEKVENGKISFTHLNVNLVGTDMISVTDKRKLLSKN